jgi:hypothetical protein
MSNQANAAWLYQMTASNWPWSPEIYRQEVWEGKNTERWHTGTPDSREISKAPAEGEIVIFFFCKGKHRIRDIGIYGWGVVSDLPKRGGIIIRPSAPSDYLKMSPLWNNDINRMIDKIRENFYERTMWAISYEELQEIRVMVRRHIGAHI